jgi:hypothetical protein
LKNMAKSNKKESPAPQGDLLTTLKARFEKNMHRHKGLEWSKVRAKLEASPGKLRSLGMMEATGGEPDVVGFDKKTGEYIFYDCSDETPKGRRSICFDAAALASRKEHKPKDSAMNMGEFDTATSSWVQTPSNIRDLGGALFCDRRFDTVFLYHNGAESYYGARGFRGALRV